MGFLIKILFLNILIIGTVFANFAEIEKDDIQLGGFIGDLINSTLNKVIANLTDPVNVNNISLDFTNDVLSGNSFVTDLQLYGLRGIFASLIDVNVLSLALNMTINVPKIIFNCNYNADLVLGKIIPLYGDGKVSVNLEKIRLLVSGRANLTGGLSLANVTVFFTLDDAEFSLRGLLDNEDFSELVSDVINDNAVKFVNTYADVISNIISPIFQELINQVLKGDSASSEIFIKTIETINKIYDSYFVVHVQ